MQLLVIFGAPTETAYTRFIGQLNLNYMLGIWLQVQETNLSIAIGKRNYSFFGRNSDFCNRSKFLGWHNSFKLKRRISLKNVQWRAVGPKDDESLGNVEGNKLLREYWEVIKDVSQLQEFTLILELKQLLTNSVRSTSSDRMYSSSILAKLMIYSIFQ